MADVSRLPAPTSDHWNWQESAACRGVDSSIFFHPDYERGESRARRLAEAKAFCARCPVIDACREHALSVEETYGTWGGLDEIERKAIIKARRRHDRLTVV